MFTKKFWVAAAERAVRGGAIAASAVWGVTTITDAQTAVSTGELAGVAFVWGGIASLLLSLAGSRVGDGTDPSFVPTPGTGDVTDDDLGDH